MNSLVLILLLSFSQGSFSYRFVLLPFGSDGAVFRSALVADGLSDFSTYYNPSFELRSRVVTFLSSYLVGTKYGGLMASPSRDFTAGALFFSDGGQEEVNFEGVKVGTYSSTYLALFLGHKLPYNYKSGGVEVVTGVSGKLLYQSIADRRSLAIALDAGAHLYLNDRILIGGSLRNLGVEVKKFYDKGYLPPPDVSLGVSLWVSKKIQFLFSTGFEFGQGLTFDTGIKLVPLDVLIMQAGYSSKGRELNTGSSLDILNGIAAGFVLRLKSLNVSYSIMPMGELGLTHYIGVVYR